MASKTPSNEICLTRVYDAPVSAVWDAWTSLEQVEQWWGPRGFTLTTHEKDLRVGGRWRYTMHGPDGVDYPNITTYFVVEPQKKLVYDHGATETTPPLFRVTVTFTETAGKTTLDLRFALASPEAAAEMAKFIKKAGGNATWDRLAEHLGHTLAGKSRFVLQRTFDAPIARVFEMWTKADHLAAWLPPAGSTMRFLRAEIAAGKSTLFVLDPGNVHVRAEYLVIDPPSRVVYVQQFLDAQGNVVTPPGTEVWPTTLETTVLLVAEAPDRTRVSVTTEPIGAFSAAERAAFEKERSGMTVGWTGSLDALEAQVAL